MTSTQQEATMPSIGKYPNDVRRDRQDVPETYEQDRERLTESEAHLRQTEDPVSGARPETEPVEPRADQPADDEGDAAR
jgi:hypothetical protein